MSYYRPGKSWPSKSEYYFPMMIQPSSRISIIATPREATKAEVINFSFKSKQAFIFDNTVQ